jgi:hypothetical protein
MWKKLIFVFVILCVLMPRLSHGQEAKAVLEGVAKAMGDVQSLQYTGLPLVGRNGTCASLPQLEQVAENISRGPRSRDP